MPVAIENTARPHWRAVRVDAEAGPWIILAIRKSPREFSEISGMVGHRAPVGWLQKGVTLITPIGVALTTIEYFAIVVIPGGTGVGISSGVSSHSVGDFPVRLAIEYRIARHVSIVGLLETPARQYDGGGGREVRSFLASKSCF